MITKEKAQSLIEDAIQYEIKHSYYPQAIEIAEEAKELLSRDIEDQKDSILKFRIRETQAQKEQRIRLTNTVTSVAIEPVYTYWWDLWRVDGIGTSFDIEDQKVLETVKVKMSDYYDGLSLHRYTFETAFQFNKYDPNAWILFERENTFGKDGSATGANFYPVVYPTQSVLNFSMSKNGVDWVIFQEVITKTIELKGERKTIDVSDFWIYGAGFFWHYAEMPEELWGSLTEGEQDMFTDYVKVNLKHGGKEQTFLFTYQENGYTEVPAMPIGAYVSGSHKKQIRVTPIDTAIPVCRDLQRDKTYLDTTTALNTFPRLFEIIKPCGWKDADNHFCEGGLVGNMIPEDYKDKGGKFSDNTCPGCGGSGISSHTSEQDSIQIPYPEPGQEWPDLSKLSHREDANLELPKWLEEKIDKLTRKVMAVTLNQELFDQTQVVKTATEAGLNHNRLYNKLSPFAEHVAKIWGLQYRLAFQVYNQPEGKATMTYPADFAMKTIEQLELDYQRAVQSGLGYEVQWQIKCQILEKIHRNNPALVAEIKAFEKYRPFKDKTEQMALNIVQGRAVDDPQRILFENWTEVQEVVKEKLRNTESRFQDLAPDAQKTAIEEAVETVSGVIKYSGGIDLADEIKTAVGQAAPQE